MNDYIYYLKVDGKVLGDEIFETEQQALDYAEKKQFEDYFVLEWDVD